MLIGSAASRRVLLRQIWAMVQTRAEAASLVVSLQKTALIQGAALYAVAALATSAFITALIFFIAVAVPAEYRTLVLGLVVLALAGAAVFAAMKAGQLVKRDTALIADFTKGLRLDLAMINLALEDPEPDDEAEMAKRERAKAAVREAAADKANTPSTAEGGEASPTGPSVAAATAAMTAAAAATGATGSTMPPAAPESEARAAASLDEAVVRTAMRDGDGAADGLDAEAEAALPAAATEREKPEPPWTAPDSLTTTTTREYRSNGTA